MMSTRQRIRCMVVAGLFVLGLSGISLAQEKIVVAGTGDSQKLLQILARAFEKATPGTKVEVPDSIGSGGGIRATAKGISDLGRVARPIKKNEKKYNLSYKVFAYSSVVFAANPNMKGIDNLTSEQIIGIYSGKITSWDKLGGEKRKIYVANREKGDSCRKNLEDNIPGFEDIKTFAGKIIYSTPETIEVIARQRNTIGYASLSMVKWKNLIVMKLDGVYPSLENVQNGKYKLVIPFGIVWKGELSGLAKAFFDFLFSTEAQKIINQNGAVPAPLKK